MNFSPKYRFQKNIEDIFQSEKIFQSFLEIKSVKSV